MKKVLFLSLLLSASLVAARAQTTDAVAHNFVTIDYPASGVTDTEATAINSSGIIVGRYLTPDGVGHGFVLMNGVFTSVDIPGTTCGTDVAWVNSRGEIVGTYCTDRSHAFVLSNGALTTIDASTDPYYPHTVGYGVSNTDDVVGVNSGADFLSGRGFFYRSGKGAGPFYVPHAVGTFPTMILDPQRIVGTYLGADNVFHGFFYDRGKFSTIDVPNSIFTWITGLNTGGDIVGFYVDQLGSQHGVVLSQGNFITIDIPGATSTEVNGLDPKGNLVGRYTTPDGITHGYYMPRPY